MSKLDFCFAIILLLGLSIYGIQAQTLRSLASAHHKYIGVALGPQQFADSNFTTVLDREIDCLTPENAMKWGPLEATREVMHYQAGDELVAHAHKHGMKVRGHTLLWHAHPPVWLTDGHFNATELRSIIHHHISTVVGHWKGKIYAWDVVNEVFHDNGTLRDSVFYHTLGKSFIADAFRWAHEADPAAKLYINDYSVEGVNHKSDALLALIKELKAEHVPVHGAGFQSHFGMGHVPHDLEHNLARFAALDIDVAITELDIAIDVPPTAAHLEAQAEDYGKVFGACMRQTRCVGVTMWGMSDKYSWIPQFSQHKRGAGLPFDEHFKEKPAYGAIKRALSGAH